MQFLTTQEFLRKGSRPRGVGIRCYWETYSNLDTTIGFTWIKQSNLKRGFQDLSGLHEGLVLLKDLPKPSKPNRTYMSENHLKSGFNAFSGLHEGLVLLKDLPKPSMPNRTYMRKIILIRGFQCLFRLTRRVSAIERLIQTFDAK